MNWQMQKNNLNQKIKQFQQILISLHDVEDTLLYENIYDLIYNVIPEINRNVSNLSNEKISNYYESNKSNIIKKIGIENNEEYILFVKEIGKIGKSEYKSCSFLVNDYKDMGKYVEVPLEIEYNDKKITLDMQIIKKVENEYPSIKYNAKVN